MLSLQLIEECGEVYFVGPEGRRAGGQEGRRAGGQEGRRAGGQTSNLGEGSTIGRIEPKETRGMMTRE